MYKITRLAVVSLVMCASLEGCATLSASMTTQKTAASLCASAGASLQALHAASATKAIAEAKPYAETLKSLCTSNSSVTAITLAESEAVAKLVSLAAPYTTTGGK